MAALTVKEETTDDALAAVALLRQTEGIDPARIYVLGHSLGGYLLPRIALGDPTSGDRIAGLIVMAGPTRPLEEITLEQVTYIVGLDGTVSADDQTALDELAAQVARVQDPNLSAAIPAEDLPLGIPASYWLDLRGYDPAEMAKDLAQPMLILQGERDYQVTTVDFEGWQAALASRPDVTFKLYPDLNHLFMTGEGKSTPAEYEVAGHVAEQVIGDIVDWIQPLPIHERRTDEQLTAGGPHRPGLAAGRLRPLGPADAGPAGATVPRHSRRCPTEPRPDGAICWTRAARCHPTKQAQDTTWDQTVTLMIAKGAKLTDAEKTALVEYLAKTYGP